jgi:hypothetical protein
MGFASDITVIISPQGSGAPSAPTAFKPGETLRLTVIELRGDRALIDFGTFRSIADIKVPVSLGDILLVRVLEAGNPLKLSLIGAESKHQVTDFSARPRERRFELSLQRIQTDLRPMLNHFMESNWKHLPRQILNAIARLNGHFEEFDFKGGTDQLARQIQTKLENSGFFFEKRMERALQRWFEILPGKANLNSADLSEVRTIIANDLKANLLLLKKFGEDKDALQKMADSRWLAALSKSMDTLLMDIAQQQSRVLQQRDNSSPFQVFSFLLPLSEGQKKARLKVYYPKKDKHKTKEEFQISLLLSMDRLGDIRTDFFLLGQDLTITFFVPDGPTKRKFEDHCPSIKQSLHHLFDQVFLKLVVSRKKIVAFEREDLTDAVDKRINLRI